jgi:hypothetical protein
MKKHGGRQSRETVSFFVLKGWKSVTAKLFLIELLLSVAMMILYTIDTVHILAARTPIFPDHQVLTDL